MKRRDAMLAAVLALPVALASWLAAGWLAGQGFRSDATSGIENFRRLQLIWPDVLNMPEDDRLVLAELAMQCQLEDEPLRPQNVVRCLSKAAASERRRNHRAVLERLLPSEYARSATDTK